MHAERVVFVGVEEHVEGVALLGFDSAAQSPAKGEKCVCVCVCVCVCACVCDSAAHSPAKEKLCSCVCLCVVRVRVSVLVFQKHAHGSVISAAAIAFDCTHALLEVQDAIYP